MRFDKKKLLRINDLLKSIQENRKEVIDTILDFCPKKGECDNQLEDNMKAIKCEYFTLCNVLGSYSLLSLKEKKKANTVLNMFYDRVEEKKNIKYDMFA